MPPGKRSHRGSRSSSAAGVRQLSAAMLVLWGMVLIPPFVFVLGAQDTFRQPKLLVSEALGLLSILIVVAFRLRQVARVDGRALLRRPILQATLPLVAVVTLGWSTSAHPLHVREALASLWIAVACLVAWSLAYASVELEKVLRGLVIPATLLALGAMFQYHFYNPFDFVGSPDERIRLTSLAGGAFDLAAYLMLPTILAQAAWRQARGKWRLAWGGVIAVCIYALALTQTFTALAATVVASLVYWACLLPRRRLLVVSLIACVLGTSLILGVEPLRQRLRQKTQQLARGEINHLLTGRLDAWHAAWWMVAKEPLLGVGQGAYRAEFGNAKLALVERGQTFDRELRQVYFTNAHNDFLDAAAEWGILGLLALVWAVTRLLVAARRAAATAVTTAALIWANLIGLLVLTLANFPFHLALVAYPQLLFFSWIFATAEAGKDEEGP